MKKKGAAFSIPEPCHEGWENMKPVEKGRYCSSCEKTVIDFSVMSDFQIMDFMSKSRDAVCGRMSSTQINRVMYLPQAIQSNNFSLRALVLGTALSAFTVLDASAQTKMGKVAPRPTEIGNAAVYRGEVVATPVVSSSEKLSGYIVSKLSGDSLESVSVTLFTTDGSAAGIFGTNEKGFFEIALNDAIFQPDYIFIAYPGYVEQTIKFSDMKPNMTIVLVEEPVVILGMMIREEK